MKLMNLFQMFDPSSVFGPTHMISILILMTFFSFFSKKSKEMEFFKSSLILKMGKSMGSKKSTKFISIFLIISSLNILSLIPSSFSSTSHISMNLPIALTLWLGINMLSIIKNLKGFLSHLVPTGSPSGLIPLMVMIELISNMIRPITLSVRLSANIIAGHLLVALLESAKGSFFPMFLLYTLETAVAIIQGYIFSLLTMLYFSETN